MLEDKNDPVVRRPAGKYDPPNNAYHISITVDDRNKEKALKELDRVVKEIKEGTVDCSEHNDDYMPYYWWTAYPFYRKDLDDENN